jgi:hypothetical protein
MQHNLIIRHANNAYMEACIFCNISKQMMLLHLQFCLHSNKINNCSQHAIKPFNIEPHSYKLKQFALHNTLINFQHVCMYV